MPENNSFVDIERLILQYIDITDISDVRLSVYKDLNESQLRHYYEPDGGVFIAESLKVIERALHLDVNLNPSFWKKKSLIMTSIEELLNWWLRVVIFRYMLQSKWSFQR